jgi:AraC-like DNA-binding protein
MVQGQFDRLDYQPRPVHDHVHLRLLAMDAIPLNQTWAARAVRSPFWRLYINDRAGGMLAVDSRRHPLSPTHVHLVPAWVRFDCWNDAPLQHFFVHFDPVGWPPAVVRELFPVPLALERTAGVEALFSPLLEALKVGGQDAPQAVALAKALAYHSISRIVPAVAPILETAIAGAVLTPPAPARTGSTVVASLLLQGPNPVSAALRHIESHLGGDIDNALLAKLCHLSRSHFIRTFHATVGQTPAQYIRERRVARAAEELVMTRSKIDDVAARCGFPNRFYFSRAFMQVMGVPPAKYRATTV